MSQRIKILFGMILIFYMGSIGMQSVQAESISSIAFNSTEECENTKKVVLNHPIYRGVSGSLTETSTCFVASDSNAYYITYEKGKTQEFEEHMSKIQYAGSKRPRYSNKGLAEQLLINFIVNKHWCSSKVKGISLDQYKGAFNNVLSQKSHVSGFKNTEALKYFRVNLAALQSDDCSGTQTMQPTGTSPEVGNSQSIQIAKFKLNSNGKGSVDGGWETEVSLNSSTDFHYAIQVSNSNIGDIHCIDYLGQNPCFMEIVLTEAHMSSEEEGYAQYGITREVDDFPVKIYIKGHSEDFVKINWNNSVEQPGQSNLPENPSSTGNNSTIEIYHSNKGFYSTQWTVNSAPDPDQEVRLVPKHNFRLRVIGTGVGRDWNFCLASGPKDEVGDRYNCTNAEALGFKFNQEKNQLVADIPMGTWGINVKKHFYFAKGKEKPRLEQVRTVAVYTNNRISSINGNESIRSGGGISVGNFQTTYLEQGQIKELRIFIHGFAGEVGSGKNGRLEEICIEGIANGGCLKANSQEDIEKVIVVLNSLGVGEYGIKVRRWPFYSTLNDTWKLRIGNSVSHTNLTPTIESSLEGKHDLLSTDDSTSNYGNDTTLTKSVTLTIKNVDRNSYICDGYKGVGGYHWNPGQCIKLTSDNLNTPVLNSEVSRSYDVRGGTYKTFVINAEGFDNQYGISMYGLLRKIYPGYTIDNLYTDNLTGIFASKEIFYTFLRAELEDKMTNSYNDINNGSGNDLFSQNGSYTPSAFTNEIIGKLSMRKVFYRLKRKSIILKKYLYEIKNPQKVFDKVGMSNIINLELTQKILEGSNRHQTNLSTCASNTQRFIRMGSSSYRVGSTIRLCSENVNQDAFLCFSKVNKAKTEEANKQREKEIAERGETERIQHIVLDAQSCHRINDNGGTVSHDGKFLYDLKTSQLGLQADEQYAFYIRNFSWGREDGSWKEKMGIKLLKILSNEPPKAPKPFILPEKAYFTLGGKQERSYFNAKGYGVVAEFEKIGTNNVEVCLTNAGYRKDDHSKCFPITQGHMENDNIRGTWSILPGGNWKFDGEVTRKGSDVRSMKLVGAGDKYSESIYIEYVSQGVAAFSGTDVDCLVNRNCKNSVK